MLKDNVLSGLHTVSNQITNLIYTPLESSLERLSKLAKRMFSVPAVAINLFDEKRRVYKPVVSMDLDETEQYMAFFNDCLTDEILVIEDTTQNKQFTRHPMVQGEPRIRFLVTCPLYEKRGKKVGSLTLIDFKARQFGLAELNNLNDIIKLIETEINDFRLSSAQKILLREIRPEDRVYFTDEKTKTWNFAALKRILTYQINESLKENSSFALAVVDIDNLKAINQQYGEKAGDSALQYLAQTLLRSCRDEDTIARGEQEDFMLLIHTDNPDNVKTVLNRIQDNIAKDRVEVDEHRLPIEVTIGVTMFDPQNPAIEQIMLKGEIALLRAKRAGRNQILLLE